MRMLLFFKINFNLNRKNRRHRFLRVIMMTRMKKDIVYTIAYMIEINTITFLNRLNHQIKNAVRKKENESEKR